MWASSWVINGAVVSAIDEAHHLLNDATSSSDLETAVRRSRDHDLSVPFITQTGGDRADARGPDHRQPPFVHALRRMGEVTEKLADLSGLSDRQAEVVWSETSGNDRDGHSEACLHIDEAGWFPMRVRARSTRPRSWIP